MAGGSGERRDDGGGGGGGSGGGRDGDGSGGGGGDSRDGDGSGGGGGDGGAHCRGIRAIMPCACPLSGGVGVAHPRSRLPLPPVLQSWAGWLAGRAPTQPVGLTVQPYSLPYSLQYSLPYSLH